MGSKEPVYNEHLGIIRHNAEAMQKAYSFIDKHPKLFKKMITMMRPMYMKRATGLIDSGKRYGLLTFTAGHAPEEEIKFYRYGAKVIGDNYQAVLDAEKNGYPIVYVEWIISGELLHAFENVVPINPEGLAVTANAGGTQIPAEVIEAAESWGVPVEWCSATKHVVGSILLDQLPVPALILGGSHPCDTGVAGYQAVEYLEPVPTFTFDVPYWKNEETFAYYEDSMWEEIDFLEEHLGQKLNWDKLKEVLDDLTRFNSYLREITEMMKARPCPCSVASLMYCWTARECDQGVPAATAMAKELYDITKKRFDEGRGVVENERLRVIWWDPPTAFWTYAYKWLEQEFGAVVVFDFIASCLDPDIDTSSRESMIRDLSKSHFYYSMGRQCHGPAEFLTDELERVIAEYKPDCLIYSGHNGCKHGWAALSITKDVCRKLEIPSLFMSIDLIDQRHTTEDQMKEQITAFMKENGWT